MKKFFKTYKWLLLIVCLIIIAFVSIYDPLLTVEPTTETVQTAMSDITEGRACIVFKQGTNTIWYIKHEDLKDSADITIPISSRKEAADLVPPDKWHSANMVITEDLYNTMLAAGVAYYNELGHGLLSADATEKMGKILSIALSVGVFLLLFVLARSSGAFNKVESVTATKEKDVTFADVVGHDEVINDLQEYVKILKNDTTITDAGIHPPRGLLLSGPPGTGKTLLARAMANEADIKFIYANSSSMIDRFVGMGANNIRKYFQKAREAAPCILFLDELDAIGGKRGTKLNNNEESNQTLLALLQELDGFQRLNGVLVVGATNMPNSLDPALKRAGRFDREVRLLPPQNITTRTQLLELYTKGLHLDPNLKLEELARNTRGMTGADIAFICNEAGVIASIRDPENIVVCADDFDQAFDKLLLKGNRKAPLADKEQEIVAYHEAGHAVMAYLLGVPISRVTIIGNTAGVGGYVMHGDEKILKTKAELISSIKIAYGGRCSEEIRYGEENVSTGSSSDMQAATEELMQLISTFGYGDLRKLSEIGAVDSSEMYKQVTAQANRIYCEALQLLQNNYAAVITLADKLLEVESLSGHEVETLLNNVQKGV